MPRGEFTVPRHVHSDAEALIRSMLVLDPEARRSMPDILRCRWHNAPVDQENSRLLRPGRALAESRAKGWLRRIEVPPLQTLQSRDIRVQNRWEQ
jgi:hypothetical protein